MKPFTLKQALDSNMSARAGITNRLRALNSLVNSKALSDTQFMEIIGQHPCTILADLANAEQDFRQAKSAYEAHCRSINEPAYATWNED